MKVMTTLASVTMATRYFFLQNRKDNLRDLLIKCSKLYAKLLQVVFEN